MTYRLQSTIPSQMHLTYFSFIFHLSILFNSNFKHQRLSKLEPLNPKNRTLELKIEKKEEQEIFRLKQRWNDSIASTIFEID